MLEAAVMVMVVEMSSTAFALTLTRIDSYPLGGVELLWTVAWAERLVDAEQRA